MIKLKINQPLNGNQKWTATVQIMNNYKKTPNDHYRQ